MKKALYEINVSEYRLELYTYDAEDVEKWNYSQTHYSYTDPSWQPSPLFVYDLGKILAVCAWKNCVDGITQDGNKNIGYELKLTNDFAAYILPSRRKK